MELAIKEMCCGCSACANACPLGCITMKQDEEGFFYPVVDGTKCIMCGKCRIVCPVINDEVEKPSMQWGYIVQHKDKQILKESTSGGAFTVLADWVLNKGGVVFGAAFTEKWEVRHIEVERHSQLFGLRNSKYVQSQIGNTYKKASEYLKAGRYVLFSGTPCQIEGLITYLGERNEKLITVDVVCHSIPSPGLWEHYIEFLQEKVEGKIGYIKFREKLYGYKYSVFTLRDVKGNLQYAEGIDSDPYLRAFFSDISVRPSCYHCQFKKRYRVSDFTIWDCFNTYDFNKSMDDNRGTSRVLIHTGKGKRIFDEVKSNIREQEVEPDKLILNVKEMIRSVSCNPEREEFFRDYGKMNIEELMKKYYPITWRSSLEKCIRVICAKIGIYGCAIRVYKSLVKRERRKR